MRIFPAIDMKDGCCVRLRQGKAQDVTVYGKDPAVMARTWADAGAKQLHLVDLDGAFTGEAKNLEAIKRIRSALPDMVLQLGGGIRTLRDVQERIDCGVDRIVIGTMAVQSPEETQKAVKMFPGHIVAGIDAKDGMALLRGWTEAGGIAASELGRRLFDMGITECVYTDISRDGMLVGPNFEATARMMKESGLQIIASGGIAAMTDLERCKAIGCTGVIVGKAMYEGMIDIAAAIDEFEQEEK